MITWQRTIYYLGLALVEATPAVLLLTLADADAWGVLIGVVLLGALLDWIVLRRLPPERQTLALVASGLVCALWAVKGQVLGDYGPLGDWGQALGTIFSTGPRSGIAYLSLLLALYCFWRGTRLTLHDRVSIHRLFRAIAFGVLIIGGLGAFTIGRDVFKAARASTEVLTFFAVGLFTLALGSATENDIDLKRLGWRGTGILGGAVALVLAAGVLIGSLFGTGVAQAIRALWQAVVVVIVLILAPLIWLMAKLIETLIDFPNLDRMLRQLAQQLQPGGQDQPPPPGDVLGIFPPWVQTTLRIFFALLPILIILGLLLLARSRARRQAGVNEERESLWSWGGLAEDLRGLLAGLRKPHRAGGLRAALAALRGGDAASRVRRSYIRLLLLGEAHERPRPAPQTPHEYAPAAGALLPTATQPVDTLTGAYERARYNPDSVTAADADTAERAWAAIEKADRR
jgi:hypothetical protein